MCAKLRCSFCGKSDQEVAKLAAGPGGVHICDGCVETCRVIMDGDAAVSADFDPGGWPTERLLDLLAPVDATADAQRRHLQAIVERLRARAVSWAAIADRLGVSRQSAWERFS